MRTGYRHSEDSPMTGTNGTKHMKIASVRKVLMSLLALAATAWAAPAVRAQAPDKGQQIANVFIVGTRSISNDKVMQYIHSKPGTFYSYATVQEDVSRLAASRLFKRILP